MEDLKSINKVASTSNEEDPIYKNNIHSKVFKESMGRYYKMEVMMRKSVIEFSRDNLGLTKDSKLHKYVRATVATAFGYRKEKNEEKSPDEEDSSYEE